MAMSERYMGWTVGALALGLALAAAPVAAQSDGYAAPRTPWGTPDIGGVWNSSTVTPLQRPEAQADQEFLTEEEAAEVEQRPRAC